MRLAPCALAILDNEPKTIKLCENSSYTTHDGLEAAECCKLLGLIIFLGVNSSLGAKDSK
jgi:ADP-ribosylglycohydrolase